MAAIDLHALTVREIHPLQLQILQILAAAQATDEPDRSPIQLMRHLEDEGKIEEGKLGNVSYHVRRLAAKGMLFLTEEIPRRGAVEHRYRLADDVLVDETVDGARCEEALLKLLGYEYNEGLGVWLNYDFNRLDGGRSEAVDEACAEVELGHVEVTRKAP